ncbi:MAG: hypothetical protein QOD98_2010 [Nocardioidaceae bacterium]|nr:hypothetical protein [Nocardioidaceae bacterium]
MTGSQLVVRRRHGVLLALCASVVSLLAPGLAAARDSAGILQGADGLTYQSAPLVMNGQDGNLFYGPELDLACGAGERLSVPMKALAALTRIIEKSGRKVVFSIAPGKTATMAGELAVLPHGYCDQSGLAAQNQLLDGFDAGEYLPLRHTLMDSRRQMYWKTDLHWTTVGGAAYAKALATRLDPRLGARQRYHYSSETRVGLLSKYLGLQLPETVQLASPAGPVKVRNANSADAWTGYPEFTFETSWASKPAARTWPGRTLLLGDSFMWYALENLRPIFHHGEFLWVVHSSDEEMTKAIQRSDTVVIEVYQLVLPGTPLVEPAFRQQLKAALKSGLDS